MNIIKGLIVKDLMNIKSYKNTMILLIIIFAIISFENKDASIFCPIMSVIFGMIAINSFSYDSVSKADQYILSFASRKDVVKARYIYVFLLTTIGAIIGFVLSILFELFKTGVIPEIEVRLLLTLPTALIMFVIQSIQIPIMYKFGTEKGRIIQMISTIVIMLMISGIVGVLVKELSPYSLNDANILYTIGVPVILVLYFISYKISYKIYSKQEI